MKEELKIFNNELSHIKDENIKQFTIKALENLPDYFWHIPASSTGKYHPKYALGEGGLTRHVKSAVKIAIELLNLEMFKFNDRKKDMILSALLLHDGCKSGINGSKYTEFTHPLIVSNYIRSNKELTNMLDKDTLELILIGIESHMGQWNTDKRSSKVLPKPQKGMESFIHMCDYLASRKCIEMNFDV